MPFPGIKPDKAQALKPLEEAAEVFGSWQHCQRGSTLATCESLIDGLAIAKTLGEIADCIVACCNLAHALGCDDLTPYLEDVEMKNRERGRYDRDGR